MSTSEMFKPAFTKTTALPFGRPGCRVLILVLGLMLASIDASPAAEFVESSESIGAGRAQLEVGMGYERDDGFHHAPHEVSAPMMLHLGIGSSFEMRVDSQGWVELRGEGEPKNGMAELAVSGLYHLPGEGFFGSSSAMVLRVDLPTGDPAFRGKRARPSIRYIAEWDVGEHGTLGVMPGLMDNTDDQGKRYLSELFGVTYAHYWTERFRSFLEFVADGMGGDDPSTRQLTADTGIALELVRDLEVDTTQYFGLNPAAPDFAVTLGITYRW